MNTWRGVGEIAGLGVAAAELAERHPALVHGADDVRLGALAEGQLVGGDERRLELSGQLVAERRHLGPHLVDHGRPLVGLALVADARRLVVGLHPDPVEGSQGDLGLRLPRLGADLPLVRAARPEVGEELARSRSRNSATSGVVRIGRRRSSSPSTPSSNAAVSSDEPRTWRESSHSA